MDLNGKRILIADDEKHFLGSLSKRLELLGGIPLKASSGREAIEISRTHPVDMAIIDYYMPEMAGIDTIARLRSMNPQLVTVLLTSFGNNSLRNDAESLHTVCFEKDNMKEFWEFMKNGHTGKHTDSLPEPVTNHSLDHPASPVNGTPHPSGLYDTHNLGSFDLIVPHNLFHNRDTHWLIGGAGSMEILKKKIANAAAIESHVLIIGERGTGKEIVARAIHSLSRRKDNRFIGINCGIGIMTPETLERELWGKAPNGAGHPHPARHGLFESCTGGTVFLDNIQDMTLKTQNDLWMTLSTNHHNENGNGQSDVRIIAACPGDITDKLENNTLNQGLHDLLTSFVIRIPPLRERKDDIAPLCRYFADKHAKEYGKTVQSISDEVLGAFGAYSFPGNIGELTGLIERAVLMLDGPVIELRHLPSRFQHSGDVLERSDSPLLSLEEVEKRHIVRVMKALDHNRTKASEILGISRAALWRKLKDMDFGSKPV